MKKIYEPILAELSAIDAIKWTELDINQLSQEKPSVRFPCALVAFKTRKIKDITDLSQEREATVTISLAFSEPIRTSALTEEAARERSYLVYNTTNDVDVALQGLCNDDFEPLTFVSQSFSTKNNLFISTLVFTCSYTELRD